MTRAQQTITFALTLASLYLVVFLGLVPLPPVVQTEIVPLLPFWALVTFGAYLVARLGWGILTFNDLPQAHAELMGEIEVAKRDLRDMGIDVD